MKRKKQKEFSTILYWLGGAVILGGMIAYWALTPAAPRINKQTLCPVDAQHIPATNVMLIDVTEAISKPQIDLIKTELERRLVKDAEKYEKFSIYRIEDKKALETEPESIVCNPRSKGTSFNEGELTRKKWQVLFVNKLDSSLTESLQHAGAANSPIMEMIQAASISGLQKDYAIKKKRLILVSDMMQYSNIASQYHGNLLLSDKAFHMVQADLEGVDVIIFYIERTQGDSVQPPGHKEFWTNYFKKMNARSVTFVNIYGDTLGR